MQKLTIDTGVQEFKVNGEGVLRFNPGDPNVYHRFFAAQTELEKLDGELSEKMTALTEDETGAGAEAADATGNAEKTATAQAGRALALLAEYDGKIKAVLTGVFGGDNNFDSLLNGVNLAAVGTNGQRVVQNFLDALTPILQAGAKRTVQGMADSALAEAEAERAARKGQSA